MMETHNNNNCPHCGFTDNEQTDTVCGRCHHNLPVLAIRDYGVESNGRLCPACPTRNLPDAKFCDACGNPLMRECVHCGYHNRIAACVCRDCGAELSESSESCEVTFDDSLSSAMQDGAAESDGLNKDDADNELFEDRACEQPLPSHELSGKDFRAYHSESLREYVQFWFDEELRTETELTAQDAGYHLVLHAAQLFRLTGEAAVMTGLEAWPLEERQALLTAVGAYLDELTLTDTVRQLLVRDDLEPEDLEQLEDLLLARDGLEEVLRFLPRLATGFSDSHLTAFQQSLASAVARAAECDAQLQGRPDVLSVLGEPLAALEQSFAQHGDPQRSWWFRLPSQLAQDYESRSWPTDVVGRSSRAAPANKEAMVSADEPAQQTILDRSGTDLLITISTNPTHTLAASSEPRSAEANELGTPQYPHFRWLVLSYPAHFYQVLSLSVETQQRTSEWDDAEIVAWSSDGIPCCQAIQQGCADLHLTGPIRGCRLKLRDGQEFDLQMNSV